MGCNHSILTRDDDLARQRGTSAPALPQPSLHVPSVHGSTRATVRNSVHSADWADADTLDPLQIAYYIPPQNVTRVRAIPSSYMKTEVGHWLGRPVLLKSVDTTRSDDEQARMRQRLTAEIQSMARMDHPNIVQFLGFYITPNRDVCCITEFAEGGTLRHLLDNPNVFARLTWGLEKIALAIDIASALAAMHALKPALIHRNVKASKVLLTSEKIAKLSGFGVAREKSFEYDMASGVSDLQWSAPELLLDGEDYNEQVDVYAFGVLLTELDTGAIPFATEMASMQKEELRAKITAGVIRPKLSLTCPLVIRNIVAQCLQQDPRLRPRSDKMLAMLQDAQIVLENEGGNDIP